MKWRSFIISTDEGYKLYLKHGWKEVDRWEADLGRWSESSKGVMYKNVYMIREPSGDVAP